jgi:hypothetical protein
MDTDSSDKENNGVQEFPVVTEDTPAQYINSIRGRPLLVDPYNYVYVRMKEKKGKTYWTCQRERSKLFPRYDYDIFGTNFNIVVVQTRLIMIQLHILSYFVI